MLEGPRLTVAAISRTLRRGQQRCYLHSDVEGDPSDENRTPSDIHQEDELGRLLHLVKDYEQGDMPRLDWLDVVTFRQIEKIQAVSQAPFSTHWNAD